MLSHPTLDQLKTLKLHGMARAFAELGDNPQASELDHAQWLALLLDREEAERDDRRLTYRLRNARLRHADAAIEDIDYRTPRRLDKALVQQLARGQWIAAKQNLIIIGPCGVGKSWLACALGRLAVEQQSQPLGVVELVGLGVVAELGEGSGHAEQFKQLELVECGMGKHDVSWV
jgi:DNA replication protein DnaC